MTKLNPTAKLSPTTEVLEGILALYGITTFTHEVCTRGIANTTVYISINGARKYVLRIYANGRKTKDAIERELKFQDSLRVKGIPIPRTYPDLLGHELTQYEHDGTIWFVILMDYVPGESKTTHHTPELLTELASLQAQMHIAGMTHVTPSEKSWEELRDYYASGFDTSSYPEYAQAFIERAINAHYSLPPLLPYGYCHLDLDLDGNVIVYENHIEGIIDFDDADWAPIVVCVGYSLWNVLHDEDVEKTREYLNIYESIRPLTSLERSVLPSIVMFRNYQIGALRLRKTGDPSCLSRPLQMEEEIPTLFATT